MLVPLIEMVGGSARADQDAALGVVEPGECLKFQQALISLVMAAQPRTALLSNHSPDMVKPSSKGPGAWIAAPRLGAIAARDFRRPCTGTPIPCPRQRGRGADMRRRCRAGRHRSRRARCRLRRPKSGCVSAPGRSSSTPRSWGSCSQARPTFLWTPATRKSGPARCSAGQRSPLWSATPSTSAPCGPRSPRRTERAESARRRVDHLHVRLDWYPKRGRGVAPRGGGLRRRRVPDVPPAAADHGEATAHAPGPQRTAGLSGSPTPP